MQFRVNSCSHPDHQKRKKAHRLTFVWLAALKPGLLGRMNRVSTASDRNVQMSGLTYLSLGLNETLAVCQSCCR